MSVPRSCESEEPCRGQHSKDEVYRRGEEEENRRKAEGKPKQSKHPMRKTGRRRKGESKRGSHDEKLPSFVDLSKLPYQRVFEHIAQAKVRSCKKKGENTTAGWKS